MKKAIFFLLVLAVGVVGAKSFDVNLLTGKTWICEAGFDEVEAGVKGKSKSESVFRKDGTFTGKSITSFIEPQKYTLETTETGTWRLEEDELITKVKTYNITSKDAPEIAKNFEQIYKMLQQQGNIEEEIDIITELTKNRLVFEREDSEVVDECKAK
ncbi:MAG: hypothetical protein LBI78_00780 [Campylobacteraceae bacterium]|jgi:phage tail tube protein FII|nr:hypothetical protein [Campylobacteraceae bacterium]